MDDNFEISRLFDFYSQMLTDTQRECVSLYYNDDLSLKETADILGISRQGVRDALSRAKKSLYEYEATLKLCSKFSFDQEKIDFIVKCADEICNLSCDDKIKKLSGDILTTAKSLYEQEV